MKARILVVEDESLVAKDLQKRLIKFGYDVPLTAVSGQDAINRAMELSPDLVLMDIRLKGSMDGIEAARQIHTRFDVPIIYLTAYTDEHTLERAETTHPSGYLLKPFKEKELYATVKMVLAKHRVDKQLKQNEQWLTTVLQSIGDGVITNDAEGTITLVNPVAEALTGWRQDEAIGRPVSEIFQLIHEDARRLEAHPSITAMQEGNVVMLPEKTFLITKDRTKIPIDDSVAPLKDEQGNITGAVLVFRDVSDRNRAEADRQKRLEQEQMIVQLERLNQLKDDFLSTVSHELRTPISNVKMAIRMLKLAPTDEHRQRYLDILQTECGRQIALINDLLDLQRLEADSYSYFFAETVSLQDWLPTIVEPFLSGLQERGQTLQIELAPDLPPLSTDLNSLQRVVAELLNNACKYTPADGQIVFSVSHHAATEPNSPSVIALAIRNQANIPAAELTRIFDKFYRIPNADPWKQGGTGLGLALVQKLVEQMQGTIEVESQQGWTIFTVQLTA